MFQQMLLSICNKHAPYRSLKLREFAPSWLNTEYLSAVDAREHWCKKFNKNPTPENLTSKLNAIKFALDLKDELKASYFEDKIRESNGDSKKIWSVIKEFWPSKSKANNIHKILDETEDAKKAECLNDFFASVIEC